MWENSWWFSSLCNKLKPPFHEGGGKFDTATSLQGNFWRIDQTLNYADGCIFYERKHPKIYIRLLLKGIFGSYGVFEAYICVMSFDNSYYCSYNLPCNFKKVDSSFLKVLTLNINRVMYYSL